MRRAPIPTMLGTISAAVLVWGVAPVAAPILPAGIAKLVVAQAEAKPRKRGYRGRVYSPSSLVIPPNPGLNIPNPNRPAYNSGTVGPVAVPRVDPVTPGVRPVPQLPSVGRETYSDRVVRCSQQSTVLRGDQRGAYIHNCSMP